MRKFLFAFFIYCGLFSNSLNTAFAKNLSNIYLEAFQYARSQQGLSLNKSQAEQFVLRVKGHQHPELILTAHKELFLFAYNQMNLFRVDSHRLADELFIFTLPLQYAKAYRNIYLFSVGTLNEFSSEARRLAKSFWQYNRPLESASVFEQAYIFFERINFFKSDSIKNALFLSQRLEARLDYLQFLELYEYAHSNLGLGLSEKRAANYALQNLSSIND